MRRNRCEFVFLNDLSASSASTIDEFIHVYKTYYSLVFSPIKSFKLDAIGHSINAIVLIYYKLINVLRF